MIKVLVILADGFEEIEAFAPIDILRRAGADVITAGVNKTEALSARNIIVKCDSDVRKLLETDFNAVVIPGGYNGAINISESSECSTIIKRAYQNGSLVCAICASPVIVLNKLGLLDCCEATCYPGMETADSNVKWKGTALCKTANILTARSAGCAVDFALKIVELLFSEKDSLAVAKDIVYENWL